MAIQTANFLLDRTFRFLYNSLRLWRAEIVAIEFKHRGKVWRADTPEEAVKLRSMLEEYERRHSTPDDEEWRIRAETVWTPDMFWDFIRSVGDQQVKLLETMLSRPSWVTARELTKVLQLSNEMALAGVLSGLSKQVKALGLRPINLYQVDVRWDGKKKTRSFFLDQGFRLTAEEMGWPH